MAWPTADAWLRPDALGGLNVLRFVQTVHAPGLDRFFIAVTMLGSEEFYLLILPILYWCGDRALGRRVGRLFLFSSFVNVWAKGFFHTLRPPAGQVRILFPESGGGYAFPSGHAQGAATFWGYLALVRRRAWLDVLAVALVLLVGLSRLYLGVHWPVDVVGGTALGLVLAWAWARAGRRWDEESSTVIGPVRAAGAFLFPLLLLLVEHTPDGVKLVGVFAGFSGGAVLAEDLVRFPRVEGGGRQVVKTLFGLAGLFVLRAGLKTVFPAGLLFDGLRYGLMGLWVGLLVPWLAGLAWPAPAGGR